MEENFSSSLKNIALALGGTVVGDGEALVLGVTSPERAVSGRICLLRDAGDPVVVPPEAFIVGERSVFEARPSARGVVVENAQEAFPVLLSLFELRRPVRSGIHPSTVVSPEARVASSAWIGPHCVVEEGAVVGEEAVLEAGVFVGPGCVVGHHTVIGPNAVLMTRVRTGARCLIHGGAVLGCDGFGIVPAGGGHSTEKVPQLGGVVLGDDVEIGACTTVDRGTLDDTVIGDSTKLDNHIHLGHNVRIGKNCILVAMTGIAGSVHLGDNVIMAARSGVRDHVTIGSGVTVAGNAGVTKDIPAGRVVSGFPAREHSTELRFQAALQRVPDLLSRVRTLERLLEGKRGEGDGA
jgi:UDP-3-O-[3-hydroxymyristoyl] glucosamine N-acyltransferase